MNDIEKKIQLKKHKTFALSILLIMAIVYCYMVYCLRNFPADWMGYIKAFAEAGMVGGLADWFAVTALFKYPLGLKIPHTNLIQNNKDALGRNLGDFITLNFLTPHTIRSYVEKIVISEYIKQWISLPKNQEIISIEILKLIKNGVVNLEDSKVESFLNHRIQTFWKQLSIEQWIAQGLHYLIENNEHHRLITLIMPKAKQYVLENKETIYQKIVEQKPILGLIGGKSVTNQLVQGILTFFDDIEHNVDHPLRLMITDKLNEAIHEVEHTDKWKNKINDIKESFLPESKIYTYVHNFWNGIKNDIDMYLEPNQKIHQYIKFQIESLPTLLSKEPVWLNSLNLYAQKFIFKLALKYRFEIAFIIEKTIKEWDGKELSDKLETEVGKDLQYIRINGTLVGGLVGLLIYTLTEWI